MTPATGHPMSVVRKAQRMVAAGWSAEAASRNLARENVNVSARTILRWAKPAQAKRDRQRSLAYHRRNEVARARFVLSGSTPEYRLEFMRRLDEVGVSAAAIAKVYAIVFDAPITRHQVVYALRKATA